MRARRFDDPESGLPGLYCPRRGRQRTAANASERSRNSRMATTLPSRKLDQRRGAQTGRRTIADHLSPGRHYRLLSRLQQLDPGLARSGGDAFAEHREHRVATVTVPVLRLPPRQLDLRTSDAASASNVTALPTPSKPARAPAASTLWSWCRPAESSHRRLLGGCCAVNCERRPGRPGASGSGSLALRAPPVPR